MRFLLLLIICSAATAGQRAEVKAANDIFAAGDYGKAVMKYRDITERYPDCVEAKYNLAISLLNNGESEEGENVLRELSSSSGEKLARKINSQLAYRQLAEAVKGLDDESAAGSLTPDVIKDKEQKFERSRELLNQLAGKDANAEKGLQVNKTYSKRLEEIKQQQQNQQQNSDDNQNDESKDKQDEQQDEQQDKQQQNQQDQQGEQSPQDQQDEQNQQQQDKQDEQQSDDKQQSDAQSSDEQQTEQQAEQAEREMTQEQEEKASEMAQEILQNEKDMKKKRMRIIREQQQVDKDW